MAEIALPNAIGIVPLPPATPEPPLEGTQSAQPTRSAASGQEPPQSSADDPNLEGAGNADGDANSSLQPEGANSFWEGALRWSTVCSRESLLALVIHAMTQTIADDGFSLDVAIGFRVKALTLMVCEVCIGLIAAVSTDVLHQGKPEVKTILTTAGVTAMLLLMGYVAKRRYPWNYLICVLLAVSLGITFGLTPVFFQPDMERSFSLSGALLSPCQACLCLYIMGLCLVAGIAGQKLSGERAVRTVAAAVIVALLIAASTFAIWASTEFCSLPRWGGTISVVTLCLVWAGYDMDRLTTKLNPDDYVLPCILVWFDLIVVLITASFALVASFLACAIMGGSSASACECKSYRCCCCLCTSSDWFTFKDAANNEDSPVEQMAMDEECPRSTLS